MNIFRSDSAPYALVLLVTALGWLATRVAEEFTARRSMFYSVSYGVDDAGTTYADIRLKNVSNRAPIAKARILVGCSDGPKACFSVDADSGETAYKVIAHPPLFPADLEPQGDAETFIITLSLLPRSMIDIRLNPNLLGERVVQVFYLPTSPAEENILFLEATGIVPWFVEHYARNVFLMFVVALAALALSVLGALAVFVGIWPNKPEKPNEPTLYDVTLRRSNPRPHDLGGHGS